MSSNILMVIPSRLEGDNDNDSDGDNADDADLDGFFPPRLAFGLTRPPRMVGSCWFPVERRPTTLRRFSLTCCLSLLITWTTILLLTTLTTD